MDNQSTPAADSASTHSKPTRAPKKGNASHTTRLARAFQSESGLKYSSARELVLRAAREGLLPEPIDADEMRPALVTLRVLHNASDSSGAASKSESVVLSSQASIVGGPATGSMESTATGRHRSPKCDVCEKVTGTHRPYWIVSDPNQPQWANQMGIVCAEHLPEHAKATKFSGRIWPDTAEDTPEDASADPIETWTATITPQAWQRDYAIEVDAPGKTVWDASEFVHNNREYVLGLFPDSVIDESVWVLDVDDWLRDDPNAPSWVADWSGPFDIHLRRESTGTDAATHIASASRAVDPVADLEAPPVAYGTDAPGHREPYVGEGADGAFRSAEIDRTELDTLPTGQHDPSWTPATEERRRELLASIEAWEAQATDIRLAAVEDTDAWTTVWSETTTYPFVEDEDANITGLGHQDRAEFAAAVNAYDEESSGIANGEDDEWTEDHIGHGWAILADDGERLLAKVDGKWVTPAMPGALPITTLWSQR